MAEEIDLKERFPNLQPIRSIPSLSTINGIGLMLYGSRDHDPETGTYVKTHWFTVVFVPVLALGAYRVANAPAGGWYFVGKEPIGGLARTWNLALVSAIVAAVGFGWWSAAYNSDEARAGRVIANAEKLAEEGDLDHAAELLRPVVNGATKKRVAAERALRGIVARAVAEGDPAEARQVLAVVVDMHAKGEIAWDGEIHDRGVALAERLAEREPARALDVLHLVEDVGPVEPPAPRIALQRRVLEALVAADAGNVGHTAELAVLIDADASLSPEERSQKCEALLAPLEQGLGTTEGARILGRIRAAQDRFEEAYALLQPYCDGRLEALHEAEEAYRDAETQAQNRIREALENGNVPPDLMLRFQQADGDDEATRELVVEFAQEQMRSDVPLQNAMRRLGRAASVVPVALDLGLVLLRRGRAAADPAARQADLERAEQTFLAIRGVAGEEAGYKLRFGQVLYWLGRQQEGRALFDEVLADAGNEFQTVAAVGLLYRELGDMATARRLFEEAWEREEDEASKHHAAALRANASLELEDRIEWLRRGDQTNANVRATLASSLGEQARIDGDRAAAERHFREALAVHDAQPQDDTVLNNSALVLFSLYELTRDEADLAEALRRVERALALNPSNAILTSNVAHSLYRVAIRDVVGDAFDPRVSEHSLRTEMLSYLYDDEAGRADLEARLRGHGGIAKALGYVEKAMLLAPNGVDGYEQAAQHHVFLRDEAALEDLLARLEQVTPDTSQRDERARDHYERRNEQRFRDEFEKGIARAREHLELGRSLGGTSRAIAAGMLAGYLSGYSEYGEIDPNEVVALADEAFEASPSLATRELRLTAAFFRAHHTLLVEEPDYATFVEGGERSLDEAHLVALAAVHDEALRPAILANEDVRRAIELGEEVAQRLPNEQWTSIWGLLSVSDPAAAERAADRLRDDPVDRLDLAIRRHTQPTSSSIGDYWLLSAEGRDDEAIALLGADRERGIPLPAGLGIGD